MCGSDRGGPALDARPRMGSLPEVRNPHAPLASVSLMLRAPALPAVVRWAMPWWPGSPWSAAAAAGSPFTHSASAPPAGRRLWRAPRWRSYGLCRRRRQRLEQRRLPRTVAQRGNDGLTTNDGPLTTRARRRCLTNTPGTCTESQKPHCLPGFLYSLPPAFLAQVCHDATLLCYSSTAEENPPGMYWSPPCPLPAACQCTVFQAVFQAGMRSRFADSVQNNSIIKAKMPRAPDGARGSCSSS